MSHPYAYQPKIIDTWHDHFSVKNLANDLCDCPKALLTSVVMPTAMDWTDFFSGSGFTDFFAVDHEHVVWENTKDVPTNSFKSCVSYSQDNLKNSKQLYSNEWGVLNILNKQILTAHRAWPVLPGDKIMFLCLVVVVGQLVKLPGCQPRSCCNPTAHRTAHL